MGNWVEQREFISASEIPEKIPESITARYYGRDFGDFTEITSDNLSELLEKLRSGRWESIFLSEEADEEGDHRGAVVLKSSPSSAPVLTLGHLPPERGKALPPAGGTGERRLKKSVLLDR